MYARIADFQIRERLSSRFGVLVLGPRQTGKSTMLDGIAEDIPAQTKLVYRFNEISTYERVIREPAAILRAVRAAMAGGTVLLYIDEVQYIPQVLNDCQAILDRHREQVTVLLTGSSARKLRSRGANLLPGRLLLHRLHPLTAAELGVADPKVPRILPPMGSLGPGSRYSGSLADLLTFGSLPGLCDLSDGLRREILSAYTSTYLQEEIRAEALARNLGGFSRVLECAAAESGNILNISALSRIVGVPASTVRSYFDLLHDTLLLIRVPAYTRNARKRIARTPKYVFFDTGVRNSCAGLHLDPKTLLKTQAGSLFEQYITLEIHRRIEYLPGLPWRIAYWRAASGAEVDLVIDKGDEAVPIEIKYTDSPEPRDARHLRTFMREYGSTEAYLVCRCAEVQEMDRGIYAVPWQMM